jgi:glycine/sarcosine N-methyltransferase
MAVVTHNEEMEKRAQYDHIAAIYQTIFPLLDAAVSFIRSYAGPPGGSLLDVGCGTGELALTLQKEGYQLTAFDLEPEMIRQAEAQRESLSLEEGPRFLTAGMEEMADFLPHSHFSLIYCIGNTISHLSGPEALHRFCTEAHELLQSQGRLVLQLLDYDAILEQRPAFLPKIEAGKYTFLRFYDYSFLPEKLVFTTKLEETDGPLLEERKLSLYPFARADLEMALSSSGFSPPCFYGGFDRSPAGGGKLPLVVSAEKET